MLTPSLSGELRRIEEAGLLRTLRSFECLGPNRARVDGREAVLFAGNDYLGLSQHPEVIAAARDALERYGASATASRLINGNHALYGALEESLAELKGTEAAIVFGSGYAANLGLLTALAASRRDTVLMDRLNHASLYDAAAMSPATMKRYAHRDTTALAALLERDCGNGHTLVVTDGIFSMDGDIAPLAELAGLARRHSAALVVDDAHGTGVLGPDGAGSSAAAGVHPDIEIGTLSKALGSVGGFVAGDRELIEFLVNRARPLVFSTGLPPASLAAATTAIEIMRAEPWRRRRLAEISSRVRAELAAAGFEVPPGETPIVPLIVGDERLATSMADACLERGVFVPAIRAPSVPKGRARLRMTLSAEHTDEQVEQAIGVLADVRETLLRP
jgi:8-amino-7-oxononanoate synthase